MNSAANKKVISFYLFLFTLCLPQTDLHAAKEYINLGIWDVAALESIMSEGGRLTDVGEKVAFISKDFLGTPYEGGTLIGSPDKTEILTINLEGVDCFTLLDYIEAMRRAKTFLSFKENLKLLRYRQGHISYFGRNHFFSDWTLNNAKYIEDVTEQVGKESAIKVKKRLDLLPGIEARERIITYIPSALINKEIMAKLKTGDYIGIYSSKSGLDVSHTGILIKNKEELILRHASSRKDTKKVLDENFMDYISKKKGIIILRPKEPGYKINTTAS